MKLKDGVYIEVVVIRKGEEVRLKPSAQIKYAMQVAEEISREFTGIEGVITAILDGKHKQDSKHYDAEAFDWRTRHYTKIETQLVFSTLKKRLGSDYDVVLHSTHIHIEYDPK